MFLPCFSHGFPTVPLGFLLVSPVFPCLSHAFPLVQKPYVPFAPGLGAFHGRPEPRGAGGAVAALGLCLGERRQRLGWGWLGVGVNSMEAADWASSMENSVFN